MPAAAHPFPVLSFPLAADFVERCARHIVADCRTRLPDLSAVLVVLPNPALAPRLRRALAAAAGCCLLLPRLSTLGQLAAAAHAGGQPDSLRQLALYRSLRERGWFAEAALWEICAELIALFDEMNERAVGLPQDEGEFLARLESAYAARDCQPLHFEAEVVHRLWRVEAAGPPGRHTAMALALARLADSAAAPMYMLCEGDPRPLESDFCRAWAARQPVTCFLPRREIAEDAPMQALNFAWPAANIEPRPLALRIEAARAALPSAPLAGRLKLIGAASLEAEAAAVVSEVRRWLAAGRSAIALVAVDRVAARRARALLEREGILVQDETGWKLSTTRAAALVDAWLEVVAADAYHRDLLDLVASAFIFGDLPEETRQAGLLQLEAGLARHNLANGLGRYEAALSRQADYAEAVVLLRRCRAAYERMPRGSATIAEWQRGLEEALATLGAYDALAQDAAGACLLDLLRARGEELAAVPVRLTFGEWREWLDRELESATFIDRSIDSPIVMTHLAATRLRRFDAAILIGADRDNLAPASSRAVFGNRAVRAELGLSLPTEATARLRDDLAGLIGCCGEVTATWQTMRGDEANLPCPELDLVSALHAGAWGDALLAQADTLPTATATSAGTVPPSPCAPQRVPLRLSASAYASLIACPYQFYARRMLGLTRMEAVREALEKRDYGDIVHRILWRFHETHPQLSGEADAALVADLEALSRELFAPLIADNFLEHAWLARWLDCVPAYIAWQKEREAAGWRHAGGELEREVVLPLDDGGSVVLHGRLDRLERRADGSEAVLDYKTQEAQVLKRRLAEGGEDVQLACYTLLQGERVSEAAYVALAAEKICEVPLPAARQRAQAEGQRLARTVAALRAGAGLPAHGAASVCEWCEMRGLCRKDYHLDAASRTAEQGAEERRPPAGGSRA